MRLHGNTEGMFGLGSMITMGRGEKQDMAEWVRWYRKGAQLGNAASQFSLGMMYEIGAGVKQDRKEAIRWYRKSAAQGYQMAIDKLR